MQCSGMYFSVCDGDDEDRLNPHRLFVLAMGSVGV